jgi:hypothetical protein
VCSFLFLKLIPVFRTFVGLPDHAGSHFDFAFRAHEIAPAIANRSLPNTVYRETSRNIVPYRVT